MTVKSVFESCESLGTCWSAVKNISDWGEKKAILITLEFNSGGKVPAVTVGASYGINADGSLAPEENIKVYLKFYKGEDRQQYTKASHRYFSEEIPDIVKKDLELIEFLFTHADPTVQRVF